MDIQKKKLASVHMADRGDWERPYPSRAHVSHVSHGPSVHPEATMRDDCRSLVPMTAQQLGHVRSRFHSLKSDYKRASEEYSQAIEQELAEEKIAVEEAVRRYNDKARDLMNREDLRQKRNAQRRLAGEMEALMLDLDCAMKKFMLRVKHDPDLTQKQKAAAIRRAHEALMDILMDEDERTKMQNLLNMVEQLSGGEDESAHFSIAFV